MLLLYFAVFLKLLLVITKAGEIRLDESLATCAQRKGATFYLVTKTRPDNPKNSLNFLHNTYYF
jgi:hypothetical protein